jgi:hypothetical protein
MNMKIKQNDQESMLLLWGGGVYSIIISSRIRNKNIWLPCKCSVYSDSYSFILLFLHGFDYHIIQEISPVACFPLYINRFNSTIGWTLHRSFHFPVSRSFWRSVQPRPCLPVELTFFRRVSFVFFYFLDVKFHTQFLHRHWHFMSF